MSVSLRYRKGALPQPEHPHAARTLASLVRLGMPDVTQLTLSVTNNRRRLISWKLNPPSMRLSVHEALLVAPDDVAAVVTRSDQDAWKRLQKLERRPVPPSTPQLQPTGMHHDLLTLMEFERKLHMPELESPPIGWGRWPTRPPRRSLRLGSCTVEQPAIRVHPVLDSPKVPTYFVRYVVFHELLHLIIPPVVHPSRTIRHPRAFREAESEWPQYERAQAWESENVLSLIRRCRARLR